MRNQDQTLCDACLEPVAINLLTEFAADMICPTCRQDVTDYYDAKDRGETDIYDGRPDDAWVEDFNEDWGGWTDQYDDDPSPYSGTYSEM